MNCFIGIDTSTTATKALLMDERGQVLGVSSNEYPLKPRSHCGASNLRICGGTRRKKAFVRCLPKQVWILHPSKALD